MNASYANMDFRSVRFEFLLPHELLEIVAKSPIAYVPLGTYEWHCHHLPVGLDSLTAHGICLRAATTTGGVVLPALYYGTGGDHGNYPWTIMMDDSAEIRILIRKTFIRMQAFGFKLLVLFSGHFAEKQVEMIKLLATDWNSSGPPMRVAAFAVNEIEGLALPPDHAAIFETTLLGEMWPDRVDISRLPAMIDGPLPEADSWSSARHSPDHPLHGVFGPDPRVYDATGGPKVLEDATTWIAQKVVESLGT